ncbi:MAG TPA: cupin domain-containing protein [Pseudolabrys sp.]|nr:cupin domain-containing protein [Pseudolabrys sp.]
MITTEVKAIRFADADLAEEKWRPYPLFSGQTRTHDDMACHYSLLSSGHSPHPPHAHLEEEILIILKGEADILIADGPQPDGARVERLRPGSFVYYPAYQHHTIRNSPEAPVAYLMFKWRTASKPPQNVLGPTFYHFDEARPSENAKGFAPRLLFEGPTAHLGKLHAHITELQPGAGYPPHADAYDVAIVVLSGQVETLGQKVEPFSAVYYAAGEMHGMRNVGHAVARYLVFEFHGRPVEQVPMEDTAPQADAVAGGGRLRRGMRAVRRRVSELLS